MQDDSIKMENLDTYSKAIEEKAEEIYQAISKQGLFALPNSSRCWDDFYHFNDFVQDCIEDFDNLVYDVFCDNHHSVKKMIEVKLRKWCEDLAKKAIKG